MAGRDGLVDKQEDNGIGVSGKYLVQRLLQFVKVTMAFTVMIMMTVIVIMIVIVLM